jgi:hypothetical protein
MGRAELSCLPTSAVNCLIRSIDAIIAVTGNIASLNYSNSDARTSIGTRVSNTLAAGVGSCVVATVDSSVGVAIDNYATIVCLG